MKKLIPIFICICFITIGCIGNRTDIKPVPAIHEIQTICISNNQKVSSDFMQILKTELGYYGFETKVFNNTGFAEEWPKEVVAQCNYVLTYTASWAWDFVSYCRYIELHLYHGKTKVAQAVWSKVGLDMSKFDPTEKKVRNLLKKFFVNYSYVIEPPKPKKRVKESHF